MLKEINEKDVTFIEFEDKRKSKYEITNKSLQHAAGYAFIEAKKWDTASEILYKNKSLRSQTCVNALFSIEMYLKSILLNLGINVTTEKYGHKIYDMYNRLDSNLKEKIKYQTRVDKKVNKSLFNEVIKFNSFEEELKYISNDFMYLRYEYEKFINGKQIITLTDFIMFLKLNCRKISTKIFYKTNSIDKEKKMIEIKKGHDSSSYFWIMPVKVKDINKNTNNMDNIDECRDLEISIEEEDINSFLRPILLEIFNDDLDVNKKRKIDIVHYINPEADSTFEWYLTYNFFTLEDIEKIIERIKYIKKLLKEDYKNIELNDIKMNYGWIIYDLPEYNKNKPYTKEEQDNLVEKNIEIIIDFYNRFIEHMEKMIIEARKRGYNLISFMGP